MKQLWIAALLACSAISTQATAHEPGAHVHGTATLQVVLEQDKLIFDFDSPMDNLLGFEHEPRTDKQKQAAQRMIETLRRPETLFVVAPAAQCVTEDVDLDAPALKLDGDDKGDARKSDGHADVETEITFRCRQPAALNGFEVKLFDAFPGIRRLNVQMVGPKGQSAATLTPRQRRISW